MNLDRFKNFEQNVRELVLAFEKQQGDCSKYFDVDQLEIIADYYLEVSDVEGLEAAVKYGEQLFPLSGVIRLRRAHLSSIQGQYAQALEILKDLERTEPDNTDVYYALGAIHSMLSHPEQAIDYYLKAAADGYQLDMIYGNVADEYYKLGQSENAVKYYKKSLEINPEEERSLYNLACTWDEQGLIVEAEGFYSQFVLDHPFSKGAWHSLGCVYTWLSLYEKAADALEYAIAIDKTFYNAYLGLSECYRNLGDQARAVQALHDAIPYSDDRSFVLYCIGRIYFEAGNYHTASTYYHDALKDDPGCSNAWCDLGRCSQQMGYLDEAAGYYRRAIDLDPDSDANWVVLADLYILSERFSEACSLLESSRTEALDRFAFDSRLVYCYYRLGRRSRLFDLLQKDAFDFGPLYHSLLNQYPDLAQDVEIVNSITSLSSL